MHPSHNRSRRKRGKNVKHEDGGGQSHMVSRSDDGQADSFSRSRPHSHHQTDTYIPSTSRSTYSMSRDGPSSHPDSQDRSHPVSSDFYHRGGRDDHDATGSRDGDHWKARSPHDGHYRSTRGWSPRDTRNFDQGHSATHRGESSGWGTHGSHDDKHHFGRESPDWRRAEPEGDRRSSWDNKEPRNQGTRRWQSDNGWESRKRDHNQTRRPPENLDDGSLSKEDRSWEPGPGWQSRGGDQGHRNQRLRNNTQGKNKGKKNNQNRLRQRGEKERDRDRGWDRRNEDSLNKYLAKKGVSSSPSKTY
ncbi:hypothetical protein F5I97DRAFT_170120 [Phlebopus sp. FC_14]|nr:hypothetical protein F5I97DRAFT_170120 [Phlebopus sp. FC_14]